MADIAGKKSESFVWTDSEIELLVESVKVFASNCMFEGKDWEGVKSKYDQIRIIFTEPYPKPQIEDFNREEYPKALCLNSVTKERIAAKVKSIRKYYKKAVNAGRRSGGGRVVMTFYDLCHEIWAGAPAAKSIEGRLDSSLPSDSNGVTDCTTIASPFSINEQALIENESDDQLNVSKPLNKEENNGCEKIERFQKDEKMKKMNAKIPIQSQQLHCMKEDLSLKRKLAEQAEYTDKEYLLHATKMSKNMETLAGAMTGCLNMMNAMFQMQMNQQR